MEQVVPSKMHQFFLAHPSIRIKGFEHGWEPVICPDNKCEFSEKRNHMHCPLCPLKVCSQDVAYMKMHFRVKHVDEGVDCEPGFLNLKCFSQCRVMTHQKERLVRSPHWHCHRCSNISTKKTELLAHFDSPKNKGKHGNAIEIHIAQDINQGMDQLKNKTTSPSTQKYSNKHDVTTQTLSESTTAPQTRSASTMTDGRLCQSREEDNRSTQRRQLLGQKTQLEEEIHSLTIGKTTMEDTIRHLQKESKRFKEKLLRTTRDNTKLRRQLKILTAITLIPGRNRNSQENPSGSGSSRSKETQKSLSSTGTPSSTSTPMESCHLPPGAPPARSSCTPNTHLVRSNINLPTRSLLSQSPTLANNGSCSMPQTQGQSARVIPAGPSGLTLNAECPDTSRSLVSSHNGSVVTQLPVFATVNSISTNCLTTTKDFTSTTTDQMVQSEVNSDIPGCQLVPSDVVVPRSFPSYVLTSDSLNLSQPASKYTPNVQSSLSILPPNIRAPVINHCTPSEVNCLPASAHSTVDSSKEISPVVESCIVVTGQGISVQSSASRVAPQSASHISVTSSSGYLVSMDEPEVAQIQVEPESGSTPQSRNGDSIHERLTQTETRKVSFGSSGNNPGRKTTRPSSSSSSVRSKDKITSHSHISMESSSLILMNLAAQAMGRVRSSAARRPTDPPPSSANRRLQRNKYSNTKRTYLVLSGDSNIGLTTARNQSLTSSVKRRPLPSSISSANISNREDSSDVPTSDCDMPVSSSPSLSVAGSIPTNVTSRMGNENPQSVSLEVLSKSSTSISKQTKESLPETSNKSPKLHSSEESDRLQRQPSVPPPPDIAENDRQGQTCSTVVELLDGASTGRNDLTLHRDKPTDHIKDGQDSASPAVKETSLSSHGMALLEENEQPNFNLLDAGGESPVSEAPRAPFNSRFSKLSNQALKRALTNMVEMDFEALTPDISAVVASSQSSPSNSISTPSNTGTSLFSNDGTIDSLLDLHEYDLSSLTESLPAPDKQDRFGPGDVSDTESFLELCNRFGGGQDFSILDQLALPSILDERDNRIEFSSSAPQPSSISSTNSGEEQGQLERDSFLIELANFCDNNFSPSLLTASPSYCSSFLSTLRGIEDHQSNQTEQPILPSTSHLERSYASTVAIDTTVSGKRKVDYACGRTLDLGEVKNLLSESRQKDQVSSQEGKKKKKSKGKKRHRSREKSDKPKKKKRKKSANIFSPL